MPARNGIIGDEEFDIPRTGVPEEDYREIANLAKFSKTKEFKKLKEHLESRVTYYQTHLPDGRPLNAASPADRDGMWLIANAIIGELRAVISVYEQAQEAMKDIRRNV